MKPKRVRRLQLARLCVTAALGWFLMTPGNAAIGAFDNVPAATLLLPYFEIDANGPRAGTLLVTIHNADSLPHIAHVTLWTDAGIPTFAFDVYLAGKDLVEIDLRAVLAGIVPHTSRTLANEGAQSSPNVSFPSCDALLPTPRLTEQQVQNLRLAHTGLGSGLWGGQCGACSFGDQKARGYVTIDVVNRCSSKFPGAPASGGDPSYFVTGGNGIAANDNVLWGEYRIVDSSENQAYADLLVAIEADDVIQSGYTFYGRLVTGNASDNRERLPHAWDARYIAVGVFQAAYLQIWRDPGVVGPWPCGGAMPALSHGQIWAFDEQENAAVVSDEDPTDGTVTLVPKAASRIRVGVAEGFPVPSPFGFLALDLRLAAGAVDPLFGGDNQSHVSTVHTADGRFGGLVTAWPIDSYIVPRVDTPYPNLRVMMASCTEGASLFDHTAPTPTLAVTAPPGTIHLRYDLRLEINYDAPVRQVTGQVGAGVWAGPPAEAVKTANIQPNSLFRSNTVWGWHELVAPFPDFQVVFFVPGGSPSLSYTINVHYAGAP